MAEDQASGSSTHRPVYRLLSDNILLQALLSSSPPSSSTAASFQSTSSSRPVLSSVLASSALSSSLSSSTTTAATTARSSSTSTTTLSEYEALLGFLHDYLSLREQGLVSTTLPELSGGIQFSEPPPSSYLYSLWQRHQQFLHRSSSQQQQQQQQAQAQPAAAAAAQQHSQSQSFPPTRRDHCCIAQSFPDLASPRSAWMQCSSSNSNSGGGSGGVVNRSIHGHLSNQQLHSSSSSSSSLGQARGGISSASASVSASRNCLYSRYPVGGSTPCLHARLPPQPPLPAQPPPSAATYHRYMTPLSSSSSSSSHFSLRHSQQQQQPQQQQQQHYRSTVAGSQSQRHLHLHQPHFSHQQHHHHLQQQQQHHHPPPIHSHHVVHHPPPSQHHHHHHQSTLLHPPSGYSHSSYAPYSTYHRRISTPPPLLGRRISVLAPSSVFMNSQQLLDHERKILILEKEKKRLKKLHAPAEMVHCILKNVGVLLAQNYPPPTLSGELYDVSCMPYPPIDSMHQDGETQEEEEEEEEDDLHIILCIADHPTTNTTTTTNSSVQLDSPVGDLDEIQLDELDGRSEKTWLKPPPVKLEEFFNFELDEEAFKEFAQMRRLRLGQ